jgi:hypothetical protein
MAVALWVYGGSHRTGVALGFAAASLGKDLAGTRRNEKFISY